MEREGLYYYFDQEDGQEKLVITDNRAAQHELEPKPIRFHALTGNDVSAKECLQTFLCRHKSLPGTVKFKDHDYSKPRLKVAGSAPITSNGIGDISVHGARFFTPEAGKRLATLRAEEMLAREVLFTGSGTSFFLRAGYTFALEDHPRQSFDAKYLAIEVEHQGNQGASTPELRKLTGLDTDEVYRVDVTAIPATVQFRAELRTAWPRIYGTEHGTIDGEAESEYAQIDEHGRYVVRFAFDESILGNGKASTRVRMMQPHGGGVEGWHFPLRKGTEVLFTFLGGDPDRPVIAGVVPNALTPSPVTSGNHTRNVIQTGGRNRLELEDKAGLQRITLSTPYSNTYLRMGSPNGAPLGHELILHTGDNALLNAQHNWDVVVGENLDEHVGGDVKETYDRKKGELVGGDVTETYQQNHLTIVGKERSEDYGSQKSYVRGMVDETYASQKTAVGTTLSVDANGAITIHSNTSISLNAPKVHVGGTASTYKVTPHSEELYGFKNSAGAEKFDGCLLATSVNGEKYDATAASRSVVGTSTSTTGLKIDKAMQSLSVAGIKVDKCAANYSDKGVNVTKEQILANTGGFASIVKGLLKLG